MSDTETTDAVVIPDSDQPSEEGTVTHAPLDPAPTTDGSDPGQTEPQATSEPTGPKTRAKASDLEGDLRKVLDEYVTGKLVFPEGTLATPHTLAAEIKKLRGDGKEVSSGAVSAALARWEEVGFASLGTKPVVFIDYTDAGRDQGLTALKQANRSAKSAARKAAVEPKAPAAAPTPEAPAAPVENVTETATVNENVEVVEAPTPAPGVDSEGFYDAAGDPDSAPVDPAPTGTPF